MNFTHYILTRYNVGLYSGNPYSIKSPDDWMEERLSIFYDTVISVASQTNRDFIWYVLIDDFTPQMFIDDLYNFIPQYENIIYLRWSEYVDKRSRFLSGEFWKLTTRLDNDDILEPDFVEAVQAQFCGREGVIDVEGRQFDTETGKYYTVDRRYPNSPFITLVEKGANPKTVFHKTHTDLHKDYKWSAYVKGKPLYTQVIHGNNLANKITGREM